MDFIKTSSLRALIELTFQRKWNGLIWMSRKGVIAKRVKTAPDGHIENQRRTRSRLAEERCSALGQNRIRPTEVSAKVQTIRPITHTTRETCPAVGQATPRQAAHDHAARAGKQSLAAAQLVPRTTADASVRAGKTPTSGRETIGQIHPSDQAGRPKHPATTVPTRPRPDCPADRPDRPSERRGRPEAVFEAQSAQFKPKAGADLARLGLAAFTYLEHYKYFFLAL
ncbi:unnamed protein product [Microthlaspi erraticum]|uniref:Uncharacterized protein n=1 Tax=Microthlaspi erraticum TaxID=1685480 RepID=A0A6D2KAI3_9BRAS|nr:unnamed protein product [Microthlaspi erraticum]